jgi:hypothetical protein
MNAATADNCTVLFTCQGTTGRDNHKKKGGEPDATASVKPGVDAFPFRSNLYF